MDNDVIWIKEDETNNIYCCELGKAYLDEVNVIYYVNCIIGSFRNVIIPRCRTFKNPVPCTIFKTQNALHNGKYVEYLREHSTGIACFDIEKLK